VLADDGDEAPNAGDEWKGAPTPNTPAEQMWREQVQRERNVLEDLLKDVTDNQRYYARRVIPHWMRHWSYR